MSLTPVLDFTVHPDFSQVASDEPQVTVNQRFEVFFPEKRVEDRQAELQQKVGVETGAERLNGVTPLGAQYCLRIIAVDHCPHFSPQRHGRAAVAGDRNPARARLFKGRHSAQLSG